MIFKNFFSNLFKGKNASTNILNISDIFPIPSREFYSNKPDMLKLIDEYKIDYLEVLRSRKYLISNNFSSEQFNREIKMNIDLLLGICMNLDKVKSNKVNFKIQVIKIKLSQFALFNLENEIIARLIALKEVYKERKLILPTNKKNAILNEINSLYMSLITINNQKKAIENEIDAYLKMVEITDVNEIEKSGYPYTRKMQLEIIAKKVFPEKLNELSKLEIDKITWIAYMERELEIYAYTHQSNLYKLAEELFILDKSLKTKEHKQDLLEKIKELEFQYDIFSEYGRNIVSDDEIYNLYRVKFDILTIDIGNMTKSQVLEEIDSKGKAIEVYKQIIAGKIELLVKGVSPQLNGLYGTDLTEIILLVTKCLKEGKKNFDVENILYNPILCSLLLAFDKGDGLETFFRENRVHKDSVHTMYGIDFDELIFKWEDYLPLDTIMKLYAIGGGYLYGTYKFLYKIYTFMNKHIRIDVENRYKIPEGLTVINMRYIDFKDNPLLNHISSNAKDKTLVMPASLKEIQGNLFKSLSIKELVLNEGLEYIDEYFFIGVNAEKIVIPSSLKTFPNLCERSIKTKTIEFINFEDSEILNHQEKLFNFIQHVFKKEADTITSYPSNKFGYYSARDFTMNLVTLVLLDVDSLVFRSKNSENPIVINQNNFRYFRDQRGRLNFKLDLYSIAQEIARVLHYDTGYTITLKKDKNV